MITDSFSESDRPIISLKDIYGNQKHLSDICIVTFSDVIFRAIFETHECTKLAEIGACNGNIPIYSFKQDERTIAFYLSPIGSTMASQCVLEANWLIGAEKFIMFGSSGRLNYEKTANRFVIPTEAYRDEGMSYHYAPPCDYITVKNSEVVKEIFDELKLPYVVGKTWTTDAILRETYEQVEKRRAEGCIAVEMEIAGVQSVCDFHELELYTFVVTGDVLSEENYCVAGLSDANHNVDKLRVALEIARRI